MKLNKIAFPIRDMAATAMLTAMISVVAPFSIMIGPVPLTFATLMVYLTVGTLGWKYGTLSVVVYILLGAVGLPVFSNFEGGFHKIAGVTGGYIVGYIPCALATGLIAKAFKNKIQAYICGMLIGTALLYTCGTAWFMLQTGNTLPASLALCVTPFLIGDAIKIIIACVIAPRLETAVKRRSPTGSP
ncbi:MAG: biotin transporter BioY [Oscillospiraceae bacterium]|nr:biotin transporter BioY [Oscillospiraceae bacterium]